MTVEQRAIVILSVPIMEGDAEPKDWAWAELLGFTHSVLVLGQTMVDRLPGERPVSRNAHPVSRSPVSRAPVSAPLLGLAEA